MDRGADTQSDGKSYERTDYKFITINIMMIRNFFVITFFPFTYKPLPLGRGGILD